MKLIQIYDYEKSRQCENQIDSVYLENVHILLHGDNIYKFEFVSLLLLMLLNESLFNYIFWVVLPDFSFYFYIISGVFLASFVHAVDG